MTSPAKGLLSSIFFPAITPDLLPVHLEFSACWAHARTPIYTHYKCTQTHACVSMHTYVHCSEYLFTYVCLCLHMSTCIDTVIMQIQRLYKYVQSYKTLIIYVRGQQTFSVKGPRVNVLGISSVPCRTQLLSSATIL